MPRDTAARSWFPWAGWAGKTHGLGASPVPERAIPPLPPSCRAGGCPPKRLVLLRSAPRLNSATQESCGSAGCLSELAHTKLSPQYLQRALSGRGPTPQSSSWALGAADAGFMAAGTCCLACRGCLAAGGVTPRPLSAGLNGCCRLGGRPGSASHCQNTRGSPFYTAPFVREVPQSDVGYWQKSEKIAPPVVNRLQPHQLLPSRDQID